MGLLSRSWDRLSQVERLLVAALMLWVTLFAVADLLGVQFESWRAQRVGSLFFWLMPLFLWALAFRVRPGPWRGAATISTGLLVTISLLPAACAGLEVTDVSREEDLRFEPVWRQQQGASALVLYRTNCGATCSFGLVLRQERRVVPGLRMVRHLGDWYPAYSATLSRILPNEIRVDVPPYGDRRPNPIIDTVWLPTSLLWP